MDACGVVGFHRFKSSRDALARLCAATSFSQPAAMEVVNEISTNVNRFSPEINCYRFILIILGCTGQVGWVEKCMHEGRTDTRARVVRQKQFVYSESH